MALQDLQKTRRMVRRAITPLLKDSSEYEARVVDSAEQHVMLATGKLSVRVEGGFKVDGKSFLFEQIKSVEIQDVIIFYFGFE